MLPIERMLRLEKQLVDDQTDMLILRFDHKSQTITLIMNYMEERQRLLPSTIGSKF